MNEIKVSVIIPVYNGEKHLRQCLDSVCNQTLQDIEIICVDDGSTDSSYEILQEYKENDARVQIFKQQNLYAGAARNLGKSHATGEYLVFWDCDDFFELNALELMYQKSKRLDLDICVCAGNQYWPAQDKIVYFSDYLNLKRVPELEVFNRKTNEKFILNFTNEAAWNKMFRRAFVESQNLDFQPIRNGNDVYFTANALCLAERIGIEETPLVNYRKDQDGSLVGTMTQAPMTPFQAWMDVAENLIEKDVFPEQSYANKTLSASTYLLRRIKSRTALVQTLQELKDYGFEKLNIKERDEGFYHVSWHHEYANHLLHDSADDFIMYLMLLTYEQQLNTSTKKRLADQKIKEKNTRIKNLKEKNTRLKEKNEVVKEKRQKLQEEKDALVNKNKELEAELKQIKALKWYKLYAFMKK